LDSDGLIPFQVAEDTGNVGSVDSIESDSDSETANLVSPVSESPESDRVPTPVATATLDIGQLVPYQVAEDTGSGGLVESGESDWEPETEPEFPETEEGDIPLVPFPFTWSDAGFLPGGVLEGNEEAVEALLVQVQATCERDPDRTEALKRAFLSRNKYFLGRCFAEDCDKLVDHKSVCKQCNIARYCSQECAVFDLTHRAPHPVYTEVNNCHALQVLKCYVVDAALWNEHGLFP